MAGKGHGTAGQYEEKSMAIEIRDGVDYMEDVRTLIETYTNRLGLDLAFQNLESELENPAKKYAPPHGAILVAVQDEKVVGMVAWHWIGKDLCEMKRLYVLPEARGKGIAEALVTAILESAQKAGGGEMVLDTLEGMKAARHLYEKFGFRPCEPYYHNPLEGVVYLKKIL